MNQIISGSKHENLNLRDKIQVEPTLEIESSYAQFHCLLRTKNHQYKASTVRVGNDNVLKCFQHGGDDAKLMM